MSCFFSGGNDCTVDASWSGAGPDARGQRLPRRATAVQRDRGARAGPERDLHDAPPASVQPRPERPESPELPGHAPPARPRCGTGGLIRTRDRTFLPNSAYSPIGVGSSNSVIVDDNFLFVSGRTKFNTGDPDVLLRIVERDSRLVAFPQLQLVWASLEARALQLRPGERGCAAASLPRGAEPGGAPGGRHRRAARPADLPPAVTLVRGVPLPEGPNDVQLIAARPGRSRPAAGGRHLLADGSVVVL